MRKAHAPAIVLLCAACSGCHASSTIGDAGEIRFDAPLADSAPVPDASPLDADALPSCGAGRHRWPLDPGLLDGCERLLGTIDFAYAPIVDASVLSSLRWVDGELNFLANGELTSLTGLERLEHVGGLTLRITTAVEDLAPLGQLRTIENRLYLSDNRALRSLHGLERLEEVGELILDIHVDYEDVVNLDVLVSLRRVRGNVRFTHVPREQVDAFLARVEVGGTVTFDDEVIAGSPAP